MSQEKKSISFRVSSDLHNQIETKMDESGMSQSDACRELLRKGLIQEKMERNLQKMTDELKSDIVRLENKVEALDDTEETGFIKRILR